MFFAKNTNVSYCKLKRETFVSYENENKIHEKGNADISSIELQSTFPLELFNLYSFF